MSEFALILIIFVLIHGIITEIINVNRASTISHAKPMLNPLSVVLEGSLIFIFLAVWESQNNTFITGFITYATSKP